jgi:HEAT repeat protein
MAAREILRRKPLDFENTLLQLMTAAPESVRRVIARAIGQVGFDQFWHRFDRMDKDARRSAGRAMMKLLPDALQRLARRLTGDPVDQRVKALQVVQELGLVEPLRATVIPLCHHPSAKVRSKAVAAVGAVPGLAPEVVLEKVLHDPDPRVRANAIEVLEAAHAADCGAVLAARARSAHSRERANAVKAMHRMKVSTASAALIQMLRDERPEHRVGALWALRQIGWWQLLGEVGRLAKQDGNMRVRRYALGVLKGVAEQMQQAKGRAG